MVKHKTGTQGASSDSVWLCSSRVHLFMKKLPSDVPLLTETLSELEKKGPHGVEATVSN